MESFFFIQNDDSEDLIRLDSTSDIDDFDPLKSGSSNQVPLTISNPLYTYENHKIANNIVPIRPNSAVYNKECSRNDQLLLQEYGLDFSFSNNNKGTSSAFQPFNGTSKVNSQSQWTKFE